MTGHATGSGVVIKKKQRGRESGLFPVSTMGADKCGLKKKKVIVKW